MSGIRLNVTQFVHEITDFPEKTLKTEYRAVLKEAALTMGMTAVRSTPVRTGQMRGSWVLRIGKPDTDTLGPNDKTGTSTIRRMRRVLAGAFNPYQNIYLSNNDRGASFVNDGGPQNVPNRMVEKAEIAASKIRR